MGYPGPRICSSFERVAAQQEGSRVSGRSCNPGTIVYLRKSAVLKKRMATRSIAIRKYTDYDAVQWRYQEYLIAGKA